MATLDRINQRMGLVTCNWQESGEGRAPAFVLLQRSMKKESYMCDKSRLSRWVDWPDCKVLEIGDGKKQ